jgi:hypothetical protein
MARFDILSMDGGVSVIFNYELGMQKLFSRGKFMARRKKIRIIKGQYLPVLLLILSMVKLCWIKPY